MHEEAMHCGRNPELVGIYTQADESSAAKKHPIVIFINSGLLPNTGPFRLYVHLARHLASLGFNSFRFDISGIGESDRSTNELPRDKQQVKDICDVMDALESRYQNNRFVVMGICTGADNAHKAMVADKRVVGYIGVDGYFYKTKRYYLTFLLKNVVLGLFKPELWKRKAIEAKTSIRELIEKTVNRKNALPLASVTMPYRWEVPPKDQTARDYREFINNKQSALCVFTASWPYNYRKQHADSFPDIEMGDHIQVQYLESAPHIFPFAKDRELLTEKMSVWLKERYS